MGSEMGGLCRTGAGGYMARAPGRFRPFPLEMGVFECGSPCPKWRFCPNPCGKSLTRSDLAPAAQDGRNRNLRTRLCSYYKYWIGRRNSRSWSENWYLCVILKMTIFRCFPKAYFIKNSYSVVFSRAIVVAAKFRSF